MRRISVLSLVCAVLMAVPAGSAAQGVPSDPDADSPSGVVYEIPAERGRKDAAPRGESRQPGQETDDAGSSGGGSSGGGSGGGGSGGSGAVGGTSETSIRSDNNFGTSSDVPGAEGNGHAGSNGSSGAAKTDEGGGSVADLAGAAARATASTSTDGPSNEVVFPLLAVLLAVGAGIGIIAGRRSRGAAGLGREQAEQD